MLLQVCNISATFMKTSAVLQFALGKCACFLQLYRVPSPIGKDKEVSISLQVSLGGDCSQLSVDGTKIKHESSVMEYSSQVIFHDNYFYNFS